MARHSSRREQDGFHVKQNSDYTQSRVGLLEQGPISFAESHFQWGQEKGGSKIEQGQGLDDFKVVSLLFFLAAENTDPGWLVVFSCK